MTELDWLDFFGEKLTKLIADSGYSQREIAEMAHISESTLSRYMHGRQVPKGSLLLNLSYALNCDVDDMINFGDEIEF